MNHEVEVAKKMTADELAKLHAYIKYGAGIELARELPPIDEEYMSQIKFDNVESVPTMEFAEPQIDENSAEYEEFAKAVNAWTKDEPPFVREFIAIQERMLDTVKRKNHDYSGESNPFRNFELVEALGVATTEEGFVVRMSDKLMRVSNLLGKKEKVSDESVDDTLMDLAAYAMLLMVYRKLKR